MSTECLLTTLHGKVNNPALPLFGGVAMRFVGGKSGSIKTTGGAATLLFEDSTIVNIDETNEFKLSSLASNVEYNVIFRSKYNAFPTQGSTSSCSGISFNIEDFGKVNPAKLTIIKFTTGDIYGNAALLPPSDDIKSVSFSENEVSGDVGEFLDLFPNVGKDSSAFNLYRTLMTGDVIDYAKLNYKPFLIYFPPLISGELYNLVSLLRSNPAFTNSSNNGSLTSSGSCLGGSGLHLWSIYPGSSAFKITWTATTSSIKIGSVTTTFDNNGNIIS